jgi:hypothetical protein
MSEWIAQHDVTLETSSDAGACSRMCSTPAHRAPSRLRSEAARQRARDVRSFSDESARFIPRFAQDSPLPGVFDSSFRARFERRFASTTVPHEAHLPLSFYFHSCLRMSGCTYVEHQLAYTVPAENRLCCVFPRRKHFEHHVVQRSESVASRSATAGVLSKRRASPRASRFGGAAI